MSETKTIVLKIGGSVITDKNGDLAAKTEVINRLAEEVAKANVKNLIVVHGGGSFGHPTAQKHGIKDGFKQDGQRIGFAETHHVMTVLNGLVMDAFVWHEIPAVSIAPSSCVITENGRIKQFEDAALRMMLKMEFTPVLYGDTTVDEKLGFTVLSGDQLVAYLALKELCEIQGKLAKPTAADVTGGMFGKVNELIPAVEKGIPVSIVNGAKANRVYRALVGEKVEGTLIEKA